MSSRRSYTNRKPYRGLTLVEILIVFTLFGVLLTAIFGIFNMGMQAWHKASTKNEMLHQVQLVSFRMSKELELSALESLSINKTTGIVCFLSPLDSNGVFVVDHRGRPEFQEYVLYYRRAANDTVFRRTVPLISGAPQRRVPLPIETYDDGTGLKGLSTYATGGQQIAKFIKKFEPGILPEPVSQLTWELRAERKRYGTNRPESVTSNSAAYLRN